MGMWFDPQAQVEALLPYLLMQVLGASGEEEGIAGIWPDGHVFIQGHH
jgi:hypothetical protein